MIVHECQQIGECSYKRDFSELQVSKEMGKLSKCVNLLTLRTDFDWDMIQVWH